MSLKSIRAEVAAELQIDVTQAAEKSYLDTKINDACKEIWEKTDLPGALRENVFSIDTSTQLAALPGYVSSVRMVRHHEVRAPVPTRDLAPRYQGNGWSEGLLAWRIKGKSPIQREILPAGCLTLSIPEAETEAFDVVITGQTINANRLAETVTFSPGDTEKVTEASFLDIESINQPALHDNDVTVDDIDGNTLAVLPNNEYTSSYTIVQVQDNLIAPFSSNYFIECLYKPKLYPLVNDHDEFPLPGYDKAIYWKTLELKLPPETAVIAHAKCDELIALIIRDSERGRERQLNFASDPLHGVFNRNYFGVPNALEQFPYFGY